MVLSRATEVALCVVRATVRISSSGTRVTSWMLSTAPNDEMLRCRESSRLPVIAGVGDGADGPEIDLAGRQHAVEIGGDAGKQFHTRAVRPVDMPVGGQHARLLEPVVERVAVQKLDVAHADGHRAASG